MAEISNVPTLAKAKLIPLNGDGSESDESNHINVQFNPSSLKVSLANTLEANSNGGGNGSAAQFIDKSSSSLAIELMFDTTVKSEGIAANSDVRVQTQKIAEAFMKPIEGSDNKLLAPARCRFQWGAFKFIGMVGTYNETLDFFSPEGIPLRAKLGLSLKEDKYQFERDASVHAKRGALPHFVSNAKKQQTTENQTLLDTLKKLKKDAANFRTSAMSNGIENVRELNGQSLQIEKNDPPISEVRQMDGSTASAGFKNGQSDTVGSRIPGAFSQTNRSRSQVSSNNRQQQSAQDKQRLNNARNARQDIRDN